MLVQGMSNIKPREYLAWWSLEHCLAFAIYLTFVWGLAYIRHDYLWIVGDDPNLLQQSILMAKGFVPNIDFFSGYPSLSIQLNSFIIDLFGVQPLTQHIYAALIATSLGVVLFWVAKNVKPWLVLLFLIFIYFQGQWLNPTPNPGFLFEALFIAGLKKSLDYFERGEYIHALLAGSFFAISFLAKQYGIFGPVAFFIASLVLLDIRPLKQRVIFGLALLTVSSSILYLYLGKLIPNGDQYDVLIRNVLLFVVPTFAVLISVLALKNNPAEKLISLTIALRANLIVTGTFVGLVALYFLATYGANHIYAALLEIMILAPRKINTYLVPVNFSHDSWVRTTYALLILILPIAAEKYFVGKYFSVIQSVAGVFSGILLFKAWNVSSTPFISIAFVAIVAVTFFVLRDMSRRRLLAMLAGFAPCILILVPYPNYAYHIPVVVSFGLLFYAHAQANLQVVGGARHFSSLSGLLPYVVIALISWYALISASKEMNNYKTYSFAGITFRSGDLGWGDAIKEARHVENGSAGCATYACRYLLLTRSGFSDYASVIEKPIAKTD